MLRIETERLIIRPFDYRDLDSACQLFDVDMADIDDGSDGAMSRPKRAEWLQWTILGYEQQAHLNNPPYGEYAIELKNGGQFAGAVGFVPCLDCFGQIRALASAEAQYPALVSAEFGLFYAVLKVHQRRGIATEAARAMIRYAFDILNVGRVVATAGYDNTASIGVMGRAGMTIHRNPYLQPPWLQVVGVIENDRIEKSD